MMKKILPLLLTTIVSCQVLFSQSVESKGKAIAEIFTNFHYNLNDTSSTTGFGMERVYIGYNYMPDDYFSARVVANIGTPEDLPAGAEPRRYAFFREASVSYTKENLNITFGITGTHLYEYQQRFWGKRYVAKPYQSINGFGFVADLGMVIDYRFNDIFKADVTLMNGEGYSDIQLDNSLKATAGLIITPSENLVIRLYGDLTRPQGIMQHMLLGFAGFKNRLITLGAEVSYKSNLDLIQGHDAWGFSGTGILNISKNREIFVRYDYSNSAVVPGDILSWNYLLDGNFLIVGLQQVFSQNVKMALNYQGTYPSNNGIQNSELIYLNATFKF